jgi:membrane associated rhomboid family serine protease
MRARYSHAMFSSIPPVARAILIANAAVFVAEGFMGAGLFSWFALWPLDSSRLGGPGFQPWQLLSYSFLHASIWHLFVNMYGLVMFGSDLERLWGRARFMNLYLASIVTAGITQLAYCKLAGSPPFPTVGASGGVFGLLLAYAMYFPRRTVVLLIPPIPMPAWVFAGLYGLVELALGVTGTQEGVAHFAHLGGMVGAGIMIWSWRRKPPLGQR